MASQISISKHVSSFRANIKNSISEKKNLENFKIEPDDYKKMLYFFRYHIISLLQHFGPKENFTAAKPPITI